MIPGVHRPPNLRAILLLAAAVFGSAGSTLAQPAASGAPDPGGGECRTAILVYIAWQELEGAVLDPTRLRRATAGFLARSLAGQGHRIVPDEDLAPLVTRWRLRNSLMLRDEFFTELRQDLDVDRLLVAQLFLQPGRLLVAWRLIDVESGILVRVGFSGAGLGLTAQPAPDRARRRTAADAEPQGTGPWLLASEQAARALVLPAGDRTPQGAPRFAVLPIRSVGSDFGATALATHSLLEELVERGGWALPDPGLVVTVLNRAGFGPDPVSAPLRALVRERFGSRSALVGELISYDILDSRPAPTGPEGDEPFSGGIGPVDDFALSLTEIDLESGRVLASHEVYENGSLDFGWFGVQHQPSLLERLQATVAELWAGTARQPKDGGDDSPR